MHLRTQLDSSIITLWGDKSHHSLALPETTRIAHLGGALSELITAQGDITYLTCCHSL